ncbi:MAG: hypothetical protein JNJ54_25015 [Myxococcaceae bacterium]|nr:hypothetical protein [Myxococcaceae bacterium]
MRTWMVIGIALLGCQRPATENERCLTTRDCASGLTCCSGACIDVQKDTRHCGACGVACGSQNAVASCQAGSCRLACGEGFSDCNGQPADGCEVNTRGDVAHCGACGQACSTANATAACANGQCAVGACQGGYANCDGRAANGCEVATTTDLANCGACGVACAPPDATPRCSTSLCTIGSCMPGRGDCDSQSANGCETDTRTTAQHCGACDRACAADQLCVSGECRVVKLYLFGGRPSTNDAVTDTLVELQLGQRSFLPITAAAPGGRPGARAFHVAAFDESEARMLVVGGAGASGAVAADVWSLALSGATPTWTRLVTSGETLPPLTGVAAGWDGAARRWYVFGGEASAGAPTGGLFVLDVATLTWTRVTAAGQAPPARAFAAATLDPQGPRFVVHGGLGANGNVLDDTWVFDPAATTWARVMMSGPGPRLQATFLAGASPPLLFGGATAATPPLTHLDDVWELDPVGLTWTRRAAPSGPPARRHAVGAAVADRRLVVSGVFDDGQTETLYNDVWSLSSTFTWQQLRSNSLVGAANTRVGFTVVGRVLP